MSEQEQTNFVPVKTNLQIAAIPTFLIANASLRMNC